MRRLVMLSMMLVLASAARVHAELPSVDDLTRKMADAALARQTYSVDMTLTIPAHGGLAVNASGKIIGKNVKADEGFVRKVNATVESNIRIADGRRFTINSKLISNGEVTWIESRNAQNDRVRVVKHKSEDIGGQGMQPGEDPVKEMENLKEMYDLSVTGEEEIAGVKVYVLDGKIKESFLKDKKDAEAAALKRRARIKAYVGQADMFPRKMKIYDQEGRETLIREFSNAKFNEPVEDSLFDYTPPEGAQVEDKTKVASKAEPKVE